jgi:hypothetical protein
VETVYSLSGDVPPEDAAAEQPDEFRLWAGALTSGTARQVCSVRKISAGGAVLHVDHPVQLGERMELVLMNGAPLDGIVAWQRGTEVGLRFDTRIDVFSFIAQDIVRQPGERRRMPRVELSCAALLEVGNGTEYVTTRDISQGGAKIDVPKTLRPEDKVTLVLDGLPPVPGVVRWSQDNVAGIAFVPELRWQDLMVWLKGRREAGPSPLSPRRADPPVSPPALTEAHDESVQVNLSARVREGTRRWSIEVASISARTISFDTYAALAAGSLLWIVLPGLEGWPARIASIDGYRFNCEFTQPLHPAVLERILALGKESPA